jgi:hypothetical protein
MRSDWVDTAGALRPHRDANGFNRSNVRERRFRGTSMLSANVRP